MFGGLRLESLPVFQQLIHSLGALTPGSGQRISLRHGRLSLEAEASLAEIAGRLVAAVSFYPRSPLPEVSQALLDPVALVDRQGRILTCNAAWQERLPRRNLLRVLAAEPSREAFAEMLQQVLLGTRACGVLEFSWADNFWFCGKASAVPDRPGQAVVCFEEITERVAREEGSAVFRRVVDQLPDPVFLLNPATAQTVYCNQAILRHLQVDSSEQIKATDYGALFQPEHLPKLVERLSQGDSLRLDSSQRTARGRQIPVELSLALFPSLRGQLVAGVLRDISERKRHLTALQVTGSRLQAILDSAPVAIVTLTLEGFVSTWNRGAERIYGWSAQEAMLRPAPYPALEDLTALVVERRETRTLLTERVCREGSKVKLNLSLSPLLDDGGRVCGLLEVAEDVTKKDHADLLETNRRMLATRETERLHLARELHDGPMQELIAIGFSLAEVQHRLQGRLNPGEEVESVLRQQREVLRVAGQLRSMLGKLRPAGLEEFGLVPSLEGLAAKQRRDHPSAPRMVLELCEVPELSWTQQLCFFKAVQEAVNNCLKHAQAKTVRVSLRRQGELVVLTVRDDGIGFLVPVDLVTLTREDHYGLVGMAERAELAGAILTIQSEPGQGTEVRMSASVSALLS